MKKVQCLRQSAISIVTDSLNFPGSHRTYASWRQPAFLMPDRADWSTSST